MIRVVQSTLHSTTAILHVEGEQREIHVREGTGQGTTLGPILCNLFLLPLLLHWEKIWTSSATKLKHQQQGKTTDSFIHNFADDMAIITKNRAEAETLAKKIYLYFQDFLIDLHVATPEIERSKSVVIFIPAVDGSPEEGNLEPLTVNELCDKKINFVQEVKYLGHIITSGLTDEAHLHSRMGKAAQVFGALRPNLFARKEVWNVVKAKILESMIIPTLLDGTECCAISATTMSEMESLYLRFVRTSLRITPHSQRKYRLTSESLLKKLGVKPLHYYLDVKMLAYAGHVERMPPHRLPKIVQHCVLQGPQRLGRPIKNVRHTLLNGMRRKKIDPKCWQLLAKDRENWADIIRRNWYCHARIYQRQKKVIPRWASDPQLLLDQFVEKRFLNKWYVGKIVSFDEDENTNATIWRVEYDDGDAEDCDEAAIAKILCPDLHALL
jgi:hypothetical protein